MPPLRPEGLVAFLHRDPNFKSGSLAWPGGRSFLRLRSPGGWTKPGAMLNDAAEIPGQWPQVETQLTAAALITLEHHPAPAQFQPYITTLLTLTCSESQIRDMLPAAVGYLVVVLTGSGTLRFVDGRVDRAAPETLLAPTNAAVELDVAGPWYLVAAALSPLGWAALTGLDASRHRDRADPAEALLGPEITALGERLRARHASGSASAADLAGELCAFITARLNPIKPDQARLAHAVAEWLSSSFDPPVADLRRATGYSPRQLQRLVSQLFGCSPKPLSRKYRALRVAALMQDPATDPARLAGLLNLFYDQSHLIREIRHFMGRTPQRLAEQEDSVLGKAIGLPNYRNFRPNVARMPDG
jgi:AraC-like DNA-binding protein